MSDFRTQCREEGSGVEEVIFRGNQYLPSHFLQLAPPLGIVLLSTDVPLAIEFKGDPQPAVGKIEAHHSWTRQNDFRVDIRFGQLVSNDVPAQPGFLT